MRENGRRWFSVDPKSFELAVEGERSKMKVFILREVGGYSTGSDSKKRA